MASSKGQRIHVRRVHPGRSPRVPLMQRLFHGVGRIRGRMMLRRFEADARRARALDLETLRTIVEANRETEFGRAHGFAGLDLSGDASAYREAVPLHTYADLAPLVERMADGEPGVLCAEAPTLFAMSSGTSGQPKLIPTTPSLQAGQVRYYGGLLPAVAQRHFPGATAPHRGVMLLSAADSGLRTKGGVRMDAASSAGIAKLRRIMPMLWTSPFEAMVVADGDAQAYLHALFGLRELETKFVQTAFSPAMVAWLTMIEARFETLVGDIERGSLSPSLALTARERASIEPYLRADAVRARELRRAVEDGFAGFVPRVWPHLRFVAAIITGSFAAYLPGLRHYLGPHVPVYTTVYIASESILGINLWPDEPERYALAIGTSAFEFIALDRVEDDQPPTVGLDGLVVGERYEVVLTNRAGLYRYRLTDVVEVVDFFHELPVVAFCHRRGGLLDLVGERIPPKDTLAAVESFVDRVGGAHARLVDYTVARDTTSTPPRYVFYVELEDPSEALAPEPWRHLDAAMTEHSHAYRLYARVDDRVDVPVVKLLRAGAFARMAAHRIARDPGASRAQLKTPRVLDDPELLALLDQAVSGHSERSGGA